MSRQYQLRKEKCWSCEYYVCKREFKGNSLSFNSYVDVESNGYCCNKYGKYSNTKVSEDNWCSKYKKWSLIDTLIQKEKNEEIDKRQKEELEKQLKAQKEENDKILKQIKEAQEKAKREAERIEIERRKNEYNQWYSSLSLEDKEKEDEKNRRIKEETEKYFEELKKKEEKAKAETKKEQERQIRLNKIGLHNELLGKMKSGPKKFIFICAISSLLITILSSIPYLIARKAFIYSKNTLDMWIELGHSSSDSYGIELLSHINKYESLMNSTIWIPFVIVALCIVVCIFLYKKYKIKYNKKEADLIKIIKEEKTQLEMLQ